MLYRWVFLFCFYFIWNSLNLCNKDLFLFQLPLEWFEVPSFVYLIVTFLEGNKFKKHLVCCNFLWLVITAFKMRENTFSSKTENSLNKIGRVHLSQGFLSKMCFSLDRLGLYYLSRSRSPSYFCSWHHLIAELT